MTALTTQARGALATALSATGWVVHSTAPTTPIAPCLVIVPDDPWVQADRIGNPLNYTVRLKLLIVTDARTGQGLEDAETVLDAILGAVSGTFQMTRVGPPQLTDIGAQGAVMTTEVTFAVRMKE